MKKHKPWMVKGRMYMLQRIAKNKFENTMVMDGTGYLRSTHIIGKSPRRYTDGDVFVCLSCEPLVRRPEILKEYGQYWICSLLTPDGKVAKITSNGNKTKFKLVTGQDQE